MADETEPVARLMVGYAARALADHLKVPLIDQRLEDRHEGLVSPEAREKLAVLGTLEWMLNQDTPAARHVTGIITEAISASLRGEAAERQARSGSLGTFERMRLRDALDNGGYRDRWGTRRGIRIPGSP